MSPLVVLTGVRHSAIPRKPGACARKACRTDRASDIVIL
jgi:hypothetical protein